MKERATDLFRFNILIKSTAMQFTDMRVELGCTQQIRASVQFSVTLSDSCRLRRHSGVEISETPSQTCQFVQKSNITSYATPVPSHGGITEILSFLISRNILPAAFSNIVLNAGTIGAYIAKLSEGDATPSKSLIFSYFDNYFAANLNLEFVKCSCHIFWHPNSFKSTLFYIILSCYTKGPNSEDRPSLTGVCSLRRI